MMNLQTAKYQFEISGNDAPPPIEKTGIYDAMKTCNELIEEFGEGNVIITKDGSKTNQQSLSGEYRFYMTRIVKLD